MALPFPVTISQWSLQSVIVLFSPEEIFVIVVAGLQPHKPWNSQVLFMLCPGFNHKVIVVGTKSAAGSLCLSLWHAPSLLLHAFIQVQEKSEGVSHLRGVELLNKDRLKEDLNFTEMEKLT